MKPKVGEEMRKNIKTVLNTLRHNKPFDFVLPIILSIPIVGVVAILTKPSLLTLILISSSVFIAGEIAVITVAYRRYSMKSPSVREEVR